ncbi:MAG: hypothetical protein RLZZ172_1463 [Bacteroidota bacterium]|jgi:O-antigen/teichoic acid export membrane protein
MRKNSLISNSHFHYILLIPLVNLALTPIQSRLIGPEMIGLQQSFTSLIGIVIIFTTLKLETLIFQTNESIDQVKYANAALSLAFRMSILLGAGVMLYWLFSYDKEIVTLLELMILVPIILFLYSIDNIRKVQQVRNDEAKRYYRLTFIRNIFKNLLLIVIALFAKINFTIILIVETIYRVPGVLGQLKKMHFNGFNSKFLVHLTSNPKVTYIYSISLLINSLTAGWPLILIQQTNPQVGGEYAMYFRLFALPAMLISTFFSEQFSGSKESGRQLSFKLILLLVISGIFCLLMMFIPRELYTFILGESWGGIYAIAFNLGTSLSLEIFFSAVSIYLILDNSMNMKYLMDIVLLAVSISPFFFPVKLEHQIFLMNLLKSISLGVFILLIYKKHIHSRVWNSRNNFS